jgi:hypothetical protein
MPRHASEPYVENRYGGWKHMTVIGEFTASLSGAFAATPGSVLIDEEIQLGPWGHIATTYRQINLGWVIEKFVSGSWVATNAPEDWAPLTSGSGGVTPDPDPESYQVIVVNSVSPMKAPKYPGGDPWQNIPSGTYSYGFGRGQEWGRDLWTMNDGGVLSRPGLRLDPQPEDRISRLRVMARRADVAYDAGQQATIDALNYRVKIVAYAVNQVVWEKEVPLVEATGSLLMNEYIDFGDYGLVSDQERFVFIAELRRNGKTIRGYLPREYTTGEEFDPPAWPVRIATRPETDNTPWWNDQNGGQYWISAHRYGDPNVTVPWPDYAISDGVWLGDGIGYCSESTKDHLRVLAYRFGNIPATYKDGTMAVASVDLGAGDIINATISGALGEVSINFRQWFNPGAQATYNSNVDPQGALGGCFIYHQTGVTTLQEVFDAIALLDPNITKVVTGTLTNPTNVTTWADQEFRLAGGLVAVATPSGSGDNTTLRMRLLVQPPNRMYEYPFLNLSNNDLGQSQFRLRPLYTGSSHFNVPDGIWAGGPGGLNWGTNQIIQSVGSWPSNVYPDPPRTTTIPGTTIMTTASVGTVLKIFDEQGSRTYFSSSLNIVLDSEASVVSVGPRINPGFLGVVGDTQELEFRGRGNAIDTTNSYVTLRGKIVQPSGNGLLGVSLSNDDVLRICADPSGTYGGDGRIVFGPWIDNPGVEMDITGTGWIGKSGSDIAITAVNELNIQDGTLVLNAGPGIPFGPTRNIHASIMDGVYLHKSGVVDSWGYDGHLLHLYPWGAMNTKSLGDVGNQADTISIDFHVLDSVGGGPLAEYPAIGARNINDYDSALILSPDHATMKTVVEIRPSMMMISSSVSGGELAFWPNFDSNNVTISGSSNMVFNNPERKFDFGPRTSDGVSNGVAGDMTEIRLRTWLTGGVGNPNTLVSLRGHLIYPDSPVVTAMGLGLSSGDVVRIAQASGASNPFTQPRLVFGEFKDNDPAFPDITGTAWVGVSEPDVNLATDLILSSSARTDVLTTRMAVSSSTDEIQLWPDLEGYTTISGTKSIVLHNPAREYNIGPRSGTSEVAVPGSTTRFRFRDWSDTPWATNGYAELRSIVVIPNGAGALGVGLGNNDVVRVSYQSGSLDSADNQIAFGPFIDGGPEVDVTGAAWIGMSGSNLVISVNPTASVHIKKSLNDLALQVSGSSSFSGAVRFHVETWDDLQANIAQGQGAAALTQEAFGITGHQMYFMSNAQNDELHYDFQMPHSWDPTTDVHVHMHVLPCADPTSDQVVHITGAYHWTKVGELVPTGTWTQYTGTLTVRSGSQDFLKQRVISLATVAPPTSASESNILMFSIKRTGGTSPDTYTTAKPASVGSTNAANLGVLGVDVHFRKNKIGTDLEFPGGNP